jgi:hypothetical protein
MRPASPTGVHKQMMSADEALVPLMKDAGKSKR